jgi:hypothetical protein
LRPGLLTLERAGSQRPLFSVQSFIAMRPPGKGPPGTMLLASHHSPEVDVGEQEQQHQGGHDQPAVDKLEDRNRTPHSAHLPTRPLEQLPKLGEQVLNISTSGCSFGVRRVQTFREFSPVSLLGCLLTPSL